MRFSRPFSILLSICFLTLSSVSVANDDDKFEEIEWTDLIPEDDLEALLNPPEYLSDIQDGSAEDSVDAFQNETMTSESDKRFQQALVSTRVVEDFNNQYVRIPGFLVPLETNDKEEVIEYLIVPYFGACLHLPPPPPNQILHAIHPEGIELESLYTPFWFEGKLTVQLNETDLGTAAYQYDIENVYLYEE